MSKGYKRIKVNGKSVAEHRYKYERHIGRKLNQHEEIHHKNGIKTDNRLSNLQLMSRKDHMKLHGKGLFVSCKICGSKKAHTIDLCHTCYVRQRRRKRGSVEQSLIDSYWGRTNKNGIVHLFEKCKVCALIWKKHRGNGMCSVCYYRWYELQPNRQAYQDKRYPLRQLPHDTRNRRRD